MPAGFRRIIHQQAQVLPFDSTAGYLGSVQDKVPPNAFNYFNVRLLLQEN